MKLLCAILGIMLACLAANAADVDILALHKQLQAEEPRLAAMTAVKAQSLHQPNYQPKYAGGVQYKHGPRYADDKYEVIHIKLPKGSSHIDTYEKPEYKSEHEEPEYKPKYDEPEYKPEYDGTEYKHKYDKAEHKPEYEETEYKHKYDKAEYKPEYEEPEYKSKDTGYSKKAILKLWEKSRTAHRAQEDNADTYQFSSVLTCTNPKKAKEVHGEDDGLIAMPINEDLKVLPVGVCEWTVTKVQPKVIAEHATIMGSSNVVCTFTEEAEKQCDTDVLCEGMSVSGQGLLYHFDKDPLIYSDAPYKGDAEVDMDAMLNIINGVNGGKKKHVYTNGAIQFVYDAEPEEAPAKATGAEKKQEKKDAPQYTFVFKH